MILYDKLVNKFGDPPAFVLYNLFNYLIYHSCDYDQQGFAAYNALEDYCMFQDGYVQSLLTETMANEGVHLYVSKVKLPMKEKTDDGNHFTTASFLKEKALIEELSYMMQCAN